MKFVADSSALARLYLDAESAESLVRFLAEDAKTVCLSELARIEVLNVLLRDPALKAAERFEQEVAEGVRLRLEHVDWRAAFRQAESLARRFSPALRPGGHDLVLVASAVTMGATCFLSFDRNSRQRPLAVAAGLQVWPPLEKDERSLARHAVQTGPA